MDKDEQNYELRDNRNEESCDDIQVDNSEFQIFQPNQIFNYVKEDSQSSDKHFNIF